MKRLLVVAALIFLVSVRAAGHTGQHTSIHDAVAGVVARIAETVGPEDRKGFDAAKAEKLLTADERRSLGEDYLLFTASEPVVVSVVHDARLGQDPFWIDERRFEKSKDSVTIGDRTFDIWEKKFGAGEVGLGVNSLGGGGDHYFVVVRAQKTRDQETLTVQDIYPGQHSVGTFTGGARPWNDAAVTVESVPASLEGGILIRGVQARRRDGQVTGTPRETMYPATAAPDHVVLTWTGDPRTSQTIQWRTSVATESGIIAYAPKGAGAFDPASATQVAAETRNIVVNTLLNDPIVNRHTATIQGLTADTTYVYAVSDGKGAWREPAEFTTAPQNPGPFSFIYMGDAQNGLDAWGSLVRKSFEEEPQTAFYIMAGDLVNRGAERDDWDDLFQNAEGVWDRKPVVPVPGNHEYQGGNPQLYLDHFALPEASPLGELNYTLRYGNALFVMLDSNLSPERQAPWLEEQLKNSDATWKIVVYHHPAYSSGPKRDNPAVRKFWGALFDKYHVDLALQGHDHAYLRTYPMKDEKRVDSVAEGTVYIVSVSGTKYYEQGEFDYTAFGMTNVSTYQVLDIRIDGDQLEYGAYDVAGELRDSFVIKK